MNEEKEHIYREIIERYCSVIGGNTAILRTGGADGVTYECLGRARCEEKNGSCRNEKYGTKT